MAASTLVPLLLLALISSTALLLPHVNSEPVEFVLAFQVELGEGFVIVGDTSPLSWTPQDAPLMEIVEGTSSYWTLTEEFKLDSVVEFKPVRVVYDTKEPLEWYHGDNLNVTVAAGPCGTTKYIEWNGSSLPVISA